MKRSTLPSPVATQQFSVLPRSESQMRLRLRKMRNWDSYNFAVTKLCLDVTE
jgi:hypothetical protein